MLMAMLFCASPSHAQIAISGKITSGEDAFPIPGVNILVKGTATGTISDAQGNYTINASSAQDVLVFSFVGYVTQEIPVEGRTSIDVSMATDAKQLSEVVVTALGIEREKRDLGYAVQEISGDDMTKARETNIGNALAGKIAGVTVVGNPSGIGGSSRITIRGERSLNINKNQPLFIVDGVPITNEVFGSSGRNNQDVDYGNGAGFVNPDDVESMTVLKGASATALYGSRGQNGVIIIKTKSGKGARGAGVSVNTTVSFESPLRLPDYQNVYGQGLNGEFEFRDGNGGGTRDGVDEAWGPKMEGQLLRQFDSPTANGYRGGDVGNLNTQIGPFDLSKQLAERGEITPTPFIAYPDNVKDFFEQGLTYTQNVAVTGANEHGDVRASYTFMDQKGIVPNTGLNRHTFSVSSGYKLTDRLSVRSSANYIKNLSNNRPNLSYGTENLMYLFNCWFQPNHNISSLRNYWQAGREGLNQFNFNYNYHDNPYFNVYENTNGQELDRLYGNVSANYNFTDWLSLMMRVGTDYSDEFRDRRRAYSTQRYPLGSYREEQIFLQETNADFLLSFNKDVSEDISLSISAGGNAMKRRYNISDISAPQLTVPGIYSLNNSRVALDYYSFRSEKRINSLYSFAQIGFRNYLFLELTARNDWSSTLPSDNWSYFYPSVSASAVLTDMFAISGPLSFAKLRVGYASVGNDTDPYQLISTYAAQTPAQALPTSSESAIIQNVNLKPEQSRSAEAGFDIRFLQDRIGLDVTFYQTKSKNQILNVPLSNTSGYTAQVVNAGLIENRGMEVMMTLVPVRTRNLEWSMNVNFSTNRSKVVDLYTDPQSGQEIKNYVLANRYVSVEARVGERMGDMYGIGFQRVSADPSSEYYDPTGQYVGQIIYTDAGKPMPTDETIKLGNYNPDWLAGVYNTLKFKGISLGFLFDIRYGGKIYSHTQTVGREGGRIVETLEGRANGYDLTQPGNGVTGEGVVLITDENGDVTGFTPNTTKLSAREWHTSLTLGRTLLESMMYDASFVKLREVKLGYTLPNKLMTTLPLRDVNISFVGRNLFLWTDVPHVDPETASTGGGTIIPGVESVALPSVRSYGFNLSFKL